MLEFGFLKGGDFRNLRIVGFHKVQCYIGFVCLLCYSGDFNMAVIIAYLVMFIGDLDNIVAGGVFGEFQTKSAVFDVVVGGHD